MIAWRGFIVDGHHRYKICCKHGLHFPTVEYPFEDEYYALMHIHKNQIGKRNVLPIKRVEHVKAADELRVKRDAKKRQGCRTDIQLTFCNIPQNSGRNSNKEDRSQKGERQLAAKAKVFHENFRKASKIYDFATRKLKRSFGKER